MMAVCVIIEVKFREEAEDCGSGEKSSLRTSICDISERL